jgi:hypothetical protein
MSGPEEKFGRPDEHLRETLERELGEVPPESPSEPPPEVKKEGESEERESPEQTDDGE